MKFNPKRLCPKIVLRPLIFLLILGLSGLITFKLCLLTKQNDRRVALESFAVQNKTFSEIETTSRLLPPLYSSAMNFARSLSSFLNGTELSFVDIETKVAPKLFLALSTIPYLSQVSYIGHDGLLFSYYKNKDEMLAVFSNSSFSSFWYTMPVNRDTGNLYGDAVSSKSIVNVNSSWIQELLNSTNIVHSSLGTGWNKADQDDSDLFFNAVAMDGRGVVSFGFPVKVVIDHFAALDFHGGDFHLATADYGEVIVQTRLQDTQMVIFNSTILVQTLKPNGDFKSYVGNASCQADDRGLRSFSGKIRGIKYMFHCSTIDIAGVQSVYVLAYPPNGLVGLVHETSKLSLFLLVFMFGFTVISLGIFIFFIIRAAKREMFLCAALINQTQATQQAERKSMHKTTAFAKTNHDVRGCLAVIIGLVELCHEIVNPQSELAANLVQIRTCTKDLLGILNSVLDLSKIEAGKMDLVEEEFNLAQLLEDVVDRYYSVGMKKGLDVVLDPCDGSILKLLLVRGDSGKLKQILCNLLSNAIKFTPEGHVSVRAVVKKKSFEKGIIASNCNIASKSLSRLFYMKKEGFNDLDALHTAEHNPNSMEVEFEVDDTGKGIPKEKQTSVFEDFVQVRETAHGLEGCGLGLGIVQSMVRIMGGEIRIVEKEPGEKGTCFRFKVQLTTSEPEAADEESHRMVHNDWSAHQHFPFFRNPATKPEGSHVMLFIAGEERRRVLRKYIENLNIRVTTVKQEKNLLLELEKLKSKLDPEFNQLTKSSSSNSSQGVNDRSEDVLPQYKKSNSENSTTGFSLVVIDGNAGNFYELCSVVANFKKDIPDFFCKVVWLNNQIKRSHSSREPEELRIAPPCDHIIHKPFHGSRLIEVLQLLPELKSTSECNFQKLTTRTIAHEPLQNLDPNSSNELNISGLESGISSSPHSSLQQMVIHKSTTKSNEHLNGKKIMVVEDVELLRKLTVKNFQKLGAEVEDFTNGKEAVDHICKVLNQQKNEGHCEILPYDYIVMDCEMPVMDGYEATRLIRMEEKRYDVHIPIIALTAHAMSDEASKTIHAGMDFHLTKPLQVDKLLKVIQSIDNE